MKSAHGVHDLINLIQQRCGLTRTMAVRIARVAPAARRALALVKAIEATAKARKCSQEVALCVVAEDRGLQDFCLTQRQLNVLLALVDAEPQGAAETDLAELFGDIGAEVLANLLRHVSSPCVLRGTALVRIVDGRYRIRKPGLFELETRNLIGSREKEKESRRRISATAPQRSPRKGQMRKR